MCRRPGRHAIVARGLVLAAAVSMTSPARACWEDVGRRYNINPYLLAAIAKTESNFKPQAVRTNKNGTRDIGLMQINSLWLPQLAKFGIEERHLYDPCVNLSVGAWILRQRQSSYGNTWEAVGSYHSKTPTFKWKYADKVQGNLQQLLAPPSTALSAPPR